MYGGPSYLKATSAGVRTVARRLPEVLVGESAQVATILAANESNPLIRWRFGVLG